MIKDEPSQLIINQRIRNRLIEYLEMIVDYQIAPPPFDTNELLNQWEDWVVMPCSTLSFQPPVFTLDEANLLVNVGSAWEIICNLADTNVTKTSDWIRFENFATIALQKLNLRGKLSEDTQEIFEQ
jgi:hypothetical protein